MKMRLPVGLVAAVLVATTAAAQAPQVTDRALATPPPIVRTMRMPPPPPPPESIAVPRGSYLDSCENARVEGDTLTASCKTQTGRLREGSISVSNCAGVDISNRYGFLICLTPVRARWGGRVLPPGSWINSCTGSVTNNVLHAFCLDGAGGSSLLGMETSREGQRENSMDVSRCPDGSDIANLRGTLTCIAP